MVIVPHNMVGLERMLDYKGVKLQGFHCIIYNIILQLVKYNDMRIHIYTVHNYIHSDITSVEICTYV